MIEHAIITKPQEKQLQWERFVIADWQQLDSPKMPKKKTGQRKKAERQKARQKEINAKKVGTYRN